MRGMFGVMALAGVILMAACSPTPGISQSSPQSGFVPTPPVRTTMAPSMMATSASDSAIQVPDGEWRGSTSCGGHEASFTLLQAWQPGDPVPQNYSGSGLPDGVTAITMPTVYFGAIPESIGGPVAAACLTATQGRQSLTANDVGMILLGAVQSVSTQAGGSLIVSPSTVCSSGRINNAEWELAYPMGDSWLIIGASTQAIIDTVAPNMTLDGGDGPLACFDMSHLEDFVSWLQVQVV